MIRRFAFPIALLAVIAVPAVPVRAESASLAQTLLGSEAEAKGDFDAWLGALYGLESPRTNPLLYDAWLHDAGREVKPP